MNQLKYFDLQGKVAVITGGAGLLGEQHALALLACGAIVVITDINASAIKKVQDALAEHYPEKINGFVMDVTQVASIREVCGKVTKKYGSIDILINNAAIDPKVSKSAQVKESSRFENFSLDQIIVK